MSASVFVYVFAVPDVLEVTVVADKQAVLTLHVGHWVAMYLLNDGSMRCNPGAVYGEKPFVDRESMAEFVIKTAKRVFNVPSSAITRINCL